MHNHSTPPQSRFPLLTALRRYEQITPVGHTPDWSQRVITKLLDAMDMHPPFLWSVQNVSDYLPNEAEFEDLNLYAVPSLPSFDFTWMEYKNASGVQHAISISRTVTPLSGMDAFLFHAFLSSDDPRSPMLIPAEGKSWYHDDGVLESNKIGMPDSIRSAPPELVTEVMRQMGNAIAVASVAFTFAHCKNVELVEGIPNRRDTRNAKRDQSPLLRFHELVIDPQKTRKVTAEGKRTSASDRPHRSMHITRGHFATYTDERPLFGKYTGTFWRPAHVRGSAEVGMVGKDYAVTAPRNTT